MESGNANRERVCASGYMHIRRDTNVMQVHLRYGVRIDGVRLKQGDAGWLGFDRIDDNVDFLYR